MNAFELDIWKQVKHNGKFSHTVTRMRLIHARNEREARGKVKLAEGETSLTGTLEIEVSAEFIYSCRKIGTVRKQLYYKYSDGRRPIQVPSAT